MQKHMSIHCILVLIACCVTAVTSFTIEIPDGTTLLPYNRDGYRQLPYHVVGFYAKGSWLNRLTGHADGHPLIEFFVDAEGSSNSNFQIFLYNADVVERQIIPSLRRPITPCMDIGQSHGVAVLPEMKGNAFALNAGALMYGPSTNYQHFSVRGRIYPESTGLYIVTMNACEFKNVTVQNADGTTGSQRELVTSGWTNIRLHGSITGQNPFGYLPGQLYGYLPVYTVLFVLSVVLSAVFTVFLVRVWRSPQQALLIHKIVFALSLLSGLSYWMLLMYYGRLNDANQDIYALFVTGNVLLILRNTVGVASLYLLCFGFGTLVHEIRPMVKALLVAGLVMRLSLSTTEFGLFQQATNLQSSTGLYGVASYQSPNLGWKTARVFSMVIDGLFVMISVYLLRQSLLQCSKLMLKRRLRLLKQSAVALASGGVFAVVWILVSYQISDGPLGTVGEANWQVAWLPSCLYEATYFIVFCSLGFIWLPRESDIRLWHAEMYRSTGPSPPQTDSCASEVLSTPDLRLRRRTNQSNTNSSAASAEDAQDVEMVSPSKQ